MRVPFETSISHKMDANYHWGSMFFPKQMFWYIVNVKNDIVYIIMHMYLNLSESKTTRLFLRKLACKYYSY